jgi:hypothetical protein
MKTFRQFLEDERPRGNVQDLEDFIAEHCQPLLTYIDGDVEELLATPLYRGITKGDAERIQLKVFGNVRTCLIKTVRKDRTRLDNNPQFHEVVDNIFQEKFKWKPRSQGMFCSSDRDEIEGYGSPYMVFPMGRFKYLWAPEVKDLIIQMNKAARQVGVFNGRNNDFDDETVRLFKEIMEPYIEGTYKDHDLHHAIDMGNEIMIGCDKYLAVPVPRSIINDREP